MKARFTVLSGDKADDVSMLAKQSEFLTGRKPTSLEMSVATKKLKPSKKPSRKQRAS